MKKLVAVFLVAVLGPSLVLAWLALRSLRDQEIVVHSQRAVLHQKDTDALASDLNTFMDDVRVFFGRLVDDLAEEYGTDELTRNFDDIVPARWGQASFSCVVTDDGQIICPPENSTDPKARLFLDNNRDFLTNNARAEVYQAREPVGNVIIIEETENDAEPEAAEPPPMAEKSAPSGTLVRESLDAASSAPMARRAKELAEAEPELALEGKKKELSKVVQQKVAVSQDKLRSAYPNRGLGQQQQLADQSLTMEAERQAAFQNSAPVEPAAGAADAEVQLRAATAQAQQPSPGRDEVPQSAAPPAAAASPAPNADQQPQQDSSYSLSRKTRNVQPFAQLSTQGGQFQQMEEIAADNVNATSWSALEVNWGDLRHIMGDAPEGAISRFLEDGLHVLLWKRHPDVPGTVFWTELDLEAIKEDLREIVREAAGAVGNPEVSLALLDNSSQVVAQTIGEFSGNWSRPFVASEVGEILPHWEVAAYLLDPEALSRSANLAQMTLRLMVPILLVAIGLGAILIFAEIGREMRFARQKTDFVSNVSHELKTPLTSIRMFSDLLSTENEVEKEKRTEYSGIISREAGRLTRLINNLLDFSRMERGEKKYEFQDLNAVSLAQETVENYRHQIESDGFGLNFHNLNGDGIPISGDRDALSQVLLNLLSNAEKYGGDTQSIDVEVGIENRNGPVAEIRVLDRGPGVPRKHCAKIFEKFFRADDSLSSGIEGSGLGLTLARQIAQEHGGDVVYRPRDGGGSCFALSLPVVDGTADPRG